MKFTPEVVAALQTLRDAADNDFERHRIDVLERDLSAPPTVEIINDTHQKFNGIIYRESGHGHYGINYQIHRAVWQYYHGEIPNNCHIHHIDENTANNIIENLQCLTRSEHMKLHHKDGIKGNITQFTCVQCGKNFEAPISSKRRFCSQICSANFHHEKSKQQKKCSVCGETFFTRNPHQQFCSSRCAAKFQYKNHRETRICPICGKAFEVPKSTTNICCSNSCGNKYGWQQRKSSS